MKSQLEKIMHHYGLNPAKFSERIGVQRSSISHIISGRNKPSYDFILKILNEFKDLNAFWLLTGEGSMFPSINRPLKEESTSIKPKLALFPSDNVEEQNNKPEFKEENVQIPYTKNKIERKTLETLPGVELESEIDTIVIFYKNGSFKKFTEVT